MVLAERVNHIAFELQEPGEIILVEQDGRQFSKQDLERHVKKSLKKFKNQVDVNLALLINFIMSDIGLRKPEAERIIKVILGRLIQVGEL